MVILNMKVKRMNNSFEKAEAARFFIQNKIGDISLDFAIITGTGLGELWKEMEEIISIPYEQIPHFPKSTVQSHSGVLHIAKYAGKFVAVFSGRFHYYEGYEAQEISFSTRVMKSLDIDNLIVTNVSGAVNPIYKQGDIVLIKDHINLMPANPLRGRNEDRWGSRFPDFLEVYKNDSRDLIKTIAKDINILLREGIYFAWQGPSLETPAEYEFIHRTGADLVGMSTVPEVIAAAQMDMNIMVFSVVSNVCYPLKAIKKTTVESVIAAANKTMPKLSTLILEVIERLYF